MSDRFETYTEAVIGDSAAGRLIWKAELIGPEGELLATDQEAEATGEAVLWSVESDVAEVASEAKAQRSTSISATSKANLVPTDRDGLVHPDTRPRVRIWSGVRTAAGDTWWPQSTLAVETARAAGTSGLTTIELDLTDSVEPARSDLTTAFRFEAGEAVEDVVGRLLAQVLGENEFVLPATGGVTLPGDAETGDDRYELISDLLEGCGYELVADPYGLVTAQAITASGEDGEASRWVYGGKGVPITDYVREWSARTPRAWKIEGGAGLSGQPAPYVTVFDLDTASQGWFPGLDIPAVVQSKTYPHQGDISMLVRAGYGQFRRHGIGPGTVQFTTVSNPAMRTGDLIDLTIPGLRVQNQTCRVMGMQLPEQNQRLMTVRARFAWEPDAGYTKPGVDLDPNCLPAFADLFDRADENLEVLPGADDGSALWAEIGFSWAVVNQEAVQRYQGWSLGLVNRALCDADQYAELVVRRLPAGRQVGPVVRCDGAFNGYAALVHEDGISLEMWLNGKRAKRIASVDVAGLLLGRTIRLSAVGTALTVNLDGSTVIEATDDALVGAHVGMLGYGGGGSSAPSIQPFAAGPA